MKLRDIPDSIRDFLFSKANREFLVFVSFLLLSGVFWLIMTLNETYEQEVTFEVNYTNVPKNVVITSGEKDRVKAVISDKGFNLLNLIYGQTNPSVDVDFGKYALSDGTGTVASADIQHLMEQHLAAPAKVVSIKTEKLAFYYNFGEKKKVPVHWHGTVTPEQRYYVTETIIEPDSVVVFAARQKLDSIFSVSTVALSESNFRDTLVIEAVLRKMPGVKTVPDRVKMTFLTDVLTEEHIDNVPIVGINMPEGKVLRTFPASVTVRFVTGMKTYRSLSASDFQVVADYKQFSQSDASQCDITLSRFPEGVSRPALNVTQVDYLIEEQSR